MQLYILNLDAAWKIEYEKKFNLKKLITVIPHTVYPRH